MEPMPPKADESATWEGEGEVTDEPTLDEAELEARADELRAQAEAWMRSATRWVRRMTEERPLAALAGAIGLGYVLGRISRND
jgi:hypothetical protein